MRKLVLSFFFITLVTSINATKVFKLDPSVDLPTFIEELSTLSGDNVRVRLSKGTYYIDRPLSFSNEHRSPIIIEGIGKVIISGAEPINGWELLSNGLWKTNKPITIKVHNLLVNSILATRARTPNNGVHFAEQGGVIAREGDNVEYSVVLSEDFEKEVEAIGEKESPVINLFRLFTHSKANIKDINSKKHTITFTEKFTMSFFTPDKSTGIILENYFAALDSPGEWYQDNDGFIYYFPRDGEEINKVDISATKTQKLVTVSGKRGDFAGNITFKNIVFEGCDVDASDKGIPPYQSAYSLNASIDMTYARNVRIENCEFRGLAGYAIWLMDNCEDFVLIHNYIHDVGGGGIKVGGLNKDIKRASSNIVVSNNVIHRYGNIFMGSTGIFLTFAHDCDIAHNDVSDGFYSGISAGFSWGYGYTPTFKNTISYNRIWNIGQGLLNDMAGVYALGLSPETVINNNLIWDIKTSKGGGYGVYTDEGSSDVLIENNVAYNCDGGGFHQHYGSRNIVRNNIFAFGGKKNMAVSVVIKPEDVQLYFENNIVLLSDGDAVSGNAIKSDLCIFNNNCFYDITGRELTVNGGSLDEWMREKSFTYYNENPKLRNPEQGDFRFKSKRLARKIGLNPIKVSKAGANWRP